MDKLDVTYQSAFTASEKPSTPSSVPPAVDYVSPLKKQYWDVQTDNIRKLMVGMNEEYILDAIYQLRNENPEYHEKIINILIDEYDEFSHSCEGDTDSAAPEALKRILTENELDELDICLLNMENIDRKPAAKIDPIKDTPSLKEPITTYHLGKRLRQVESELPVDMRPIHQLSSTSKNPFSTETLT